MVVWLKNAVTAGSSRELEAENEALRKEITQLRSHPKDPRRLATQEGCSRDIMYKLTGRTILTYFPPK